MADRPLLFRGAMVRALLDGRKSQTRRPAWQAKPYTVASKGGAQRLQADLSLKAFPRAAGQWNIHRATAAQRIKSGDLIWVRETIQTAMSPDGPCVLYRANSDRWYPPSTGPDEGAGPSFDYDVYPGDYSAWAADVEARGPWRPSIHMPRWASRLTLAVTAVKIERLHDLTEDDAKAEGVAPHPKPGNWQPHRASFAELWCRIHRQDDWWIANPEVTVITFTVHRANIDAFKAARAAA